MKITIVGTGHVGLVTAATLAHIGHDVVGFDDDAAKVRALQGGLVPFFEEGMTELIQDGLAAGKLRFVIKPSEAIPGAEVAFICVGTPGRPSGELNMVAIERAAATVAGYATGPMVVVEKSTVPVQTAGRLKLVLARNGAHCLDVASNPEFLREGRAVQDSLRPDRVLVGAETTRAHDVMRRLYEPLVMRTGARYFATDVSTAELAKHACNAFLALKISFINGVARICEASGADVEGIAEIMGSDARIGRDFLNAGLGWGGSCLPKDILAFRAQSDGLGYHFGLLDEIMTLNAEALHAAFDKIKNVLWNLENKRIVLLGLAFKPGTDDVRQSPALHLARMLLAAGAVVVGCDPHAQAAAAREMPELETAQDAYAAAQGAECLVLATEWPEFAELDLARMKGLMTVPILVDCRNLFNPRTAAEAGFMYIATGRPSISY